MIFKLFFAVFFSAFYALHGEATSDKLFCKDPPGGTVSGPYAYPFNCSYFYFCDKNGLPFFRKCHDDFVWNAKDQGCEPQQFYNCTLSPNSPCEGVAEFYPCLWDCTKFFHCDGSIAYLKSCPTGTEWSIYTNQCEWPYKARCNELVRN